MRNMRPDTYKQIMVRHAQHLEQSYKSPHCSPRCQLPFSRMCFHGCVLKAQKHECHIIYMSCYCKTKTGEEKFKTNLLTSRGRIDEQIILGD